MSLLFQCKQAWDSRRPWRLRRRRARNYFADQTDELMKHPDTGKLISEDEFIKAEGRIPWKMNRIRPTVKNLVGQFRQNKSQRLVYARNREDNAAGDMMTEALKRVTDHNQLAAIDADQLRESLISGLYGYKIRYEWDPLLNHPEVTVDPIDPNRLFFNPDMRDRRLKDLKFVGEMHDLDIDQVIAAFAGSEREEAFLRQVYAGINDELKTTTYPFTGFSATDSLDFFSNGDYTKCRVIEVWRYEYGWTVMMHDTATGNYEVADLTDAEVALVNQQRVFEAMQFGQEPRLVNLERRYEATWHAYWMSPDGHVLQHSVTPYWHESHPYIIGFAELLDGEIWGLVEDIIDPQRLVNRIYTAIDYMFGASAKGVLMVAEDQIPQGMSLKDFASEWAKFNGVIMYKAKPSVPQPYQVQQAQIPAGVFNWLSAIQNEIKEVSGVTGAVQGIEPQSNTPGILYQQQVMQAQLTNRDFFDSFFEVRRQRDIKICQLIAQYYDDVRQMSVLERRPDGTKIIKYDPARVRDLEFDVVVSESPDTPATRQMMEEYLTNLLTSNRLTFRQYLMLSSHPKADLILATVDKTNPLLADQQIDPAKTQQLGAQLMQAAQGGDQDAAALVGQAQ